MEESKGTGGGLKPNTKVIVSERIATHFANSYQNEMVRAAPDVVSRLQDPAIRDGRNELRETKTNFETYRGCPLTFGAPVPLGTPNGLVLLQRFFVQSPGALPRTLVRVLDIVPTEDAAFDLMYFAEEQAPKQFPRSSMMVVSMFEFNMLYMPPMSDEEVDARTKRMIKEHYDRDVKEERANNVHGKKLQQRALADELMGNPLKAMSAGQEEEDKMIAELMGSALAAAAPAAAAPAAAGDTAAADGSEKPALDNDPELRRALGKHSVVIGDKSTGQWIQQDTAEVAIDEWVAEVQQEREKAAAGAAPTMVRPEDAASRAAVTQQESKVKLACSHPASAVALVTFIEPEPTDTSRQWIMAVVGCLDTVSDVPSFWHKHIKTLCPRFNFRTLPLWQFIDVDKWWSSSTQVAQKLYHTEEEQSLHERFERGQQFSKNMETAAKKIIAQGLEDDAKDDAEMSTVQYAQEPVTVDTAAAPAEPEAAPATAAGAPAPAEPSLEQVETRAFMAELDDILKEKAASKRLVAKRG